MNTMNNSFNLTSLNSNTIVDELRDIKCTQDTDCYNIGKCDNNKCIFTNIYCNYENCYQDNKCDTSYIKHAEPQYLRPCERNAVKIFETCAKENTNCITRTCTNHEQCLSNICLNGRCISNSDNPIRVCSNVASGEFSDDIVEFSCKLFLNERCSDDNACYSNRCGKLKDVDSDIKVCIEPKPGFVNIMACIAAYIVVVVSLIVLNSFYKRTRKTK